MSIEAPISKFKKNNLKIYIGVCIVAALIFGYDGYLSKYEWSGRYKSFYTKHVIDNDGKPTATMKFNIYSPPVFIGAAILLGLYFLSVSKKKIVADENDLILDPNEKIPYDSIQKIDKTYFDSKGFFVLTYKKSDGAQVDRKLSDRTYDNLKEILEHLISKIT